MDYNIYIDGSFKCSRLGGRVAGIPELPFFGVDTVCLLDSF